LSFLRHATCLLFLFAIFSAQRAHAQETVFDVPSADVLDQGKIYGELDGTVRPSDGLATFTPRVVVGIGHDIEIGVNFDGLQTPGHAPLDISPTIKWKPWTDASLGLSFFAGDDLFFPIRDRTYNAGNYAYAALAKQWSHGTRVAAGAYDFTRYVVANANRAGGQFTFEQQVGKRLTFAVEWYTGKTSVGYVNPGLNIKLTSKFTLYGAYQIGNSGVSNGNHQFLWELGYNFN
jgi:hypothetical protein